MTVAELITELGKCPMDARVYSDDIDNLEVVGAEVDVIDMETRVYLFTDNLYEV